MATFALVDANNFYASCEKLFDPRLTGKPVVVLSNNDGCVVARSAESKTLGVPMGAPWFKIQDLVRQHGIVALSSNYALYADMSNRVVEVLRQFASDIEVYSIDESFLELSGFAHLDLVQHGRCIRERIQQWLGLGVCVGIGPTKTLAKLANHCAKKQLAGNAGVCDLSRLSPDETDQLLGRIPIEEVWGVGRQLTKRLKAMGIETVWDLRNADPDLIRRRISVVLERTVRELRGTSCLSLEEVSPPRQQIICSRSFGNRVYELDELNEAVASYVARASEKLRQQDSLAGAISVSLQTSPFSPNEPFYQNSRLVPLPLATQDTRMLSGWALAILGKIYRAGYAYQKAGIQLSELRPRDRRQGSLFGSEAQAEAGEKLMAAMDRINGRWGRGTMRLAAEGLDKVWKMRQQNLSPQYTTSWEGLPIVGAG